MAQSDFENQKFLASFNHNSENFRSLNQLMWQIPLIAMTLTGGLWFGVSKTESSKLFSACLLVIAILGNVGLVVALKRLRFVMRRYLEWFNSAHPSGFVSAEGDGRWSGDGWFTQAYVVRLVFQWMLIAAAVVSSVLLVHILMTPAKPSSDTSAIRYYDDYAQSLADSYETVAFEDAHPEMARYLSNSRPKHVIDVGAGSGRDAAWLTSKGHQVTAVEPSSKMLAIGRRLHPNGDVAWLSDSLPKLENVSGRDFDVAFLSAVWMHVDEKQRVESLRRLEGLLADNGVIYMTLRLGPTDSKRAMFKVSLAGLRRVAEVSGLKVQLLGQGSDLLGRSEVSWQRVLLSRQEEQPDSHGMLTQQSDVKSKRK
ncbi:class I SAM-dependent methyltransferase [Nostoc sp. CHAB 5715]|nr:class I SAM-dependent methyltransferase [Nostoc sp. CHAB 5715]